MLNLFFFKLFSLDFRRKFSIYFSKKNPSSVRGQCAPTHKQCVHFVEICVHIKWRTKVKLKVLNGQERVRSSELQFSKHFVLSVCFRPCPSLLIPSGEVTRAINTCASKSKWRLRLEPRSNSVCTWKRSNPVHTWKFCETNCGHPRSGTPRS